MEQVCSHMKSTVDEAQVVVSPGSDGQVADDDDDRDIDRAVDLENMT